MRFIDRQIGLNVAEAALFMSTVAIGMLANRIDRQLAMPRDPRTRQDSLESDTDDLRR